MWNVQCVSLVDMTRFASFRTQTIAEVPCHVIFFCEALYRWHGTYAFFCFFHFTDDMGVFVFWVCSTTPMSSAGTIIYFGRMYMSNWQNYCNTNFVFASPWPVRGVGNYPFHPFPLCRSSRAGQWQDGNLLWFVVNCIRQTPSNPMKTHLNPIGMVHHLWC